MQPDTLDVKTVNNTSSYVVMTKVILHYHDKRIFLVIQKEELTENFCDQLLLNTVASY